MAQKQVLLEVKLGITDAVKQMAQYESEVAKIDDKLKVLNKQIKEEGDSSGKLRQEVVRLTESKKAYKKEIGELSRGVQNTIVAETKYKDTLKGLCAELSVAKDKLRAMKLSGEENSKAYAQQSEYVGKLNDKIKEMEAAYGVHTRNVGNYEMAVSKSKEEVAGLIQELARLKFENKENSEEFAKAQQELDDYSSGLQESNKSSLEFANSGLTTCVGALTAMSLCINQETEEGKKWAALIQKLQVATTTMAAIMAAYQAVEQKGIIQKIASNIQVKAGVIALKMQARAQAAATTATTAATVAQKALNKAMSANPIGLIVAAVALLVSGLVALVSWLLKSSDAEQAAENAQKAYEEQVRKSENALAALEAQEAKRATETAVRYNNEIAQMMQAGATKEAIDKKRAEAEAELNRQSIEASKIRRQEALAELALAKKNYETQLALLNELIAKKGEDSKKTIEQKQKMDEAFRAFKGYEKTVAELDRAISDGLLKDIETSYNAAQEAQNKAYENAARNLDKWEKTRQQRYKRYFQFEEDFRLTDTENAVEKHKFEMKMEYNLFLEQQRVQKQRLAQDLKFGKITRKQQTDALALMAEELETFQKEHALKHNNFVLGLLRSAIDLAGGRSLADSIGIIQSDYANAAEVIKKNSLLTAEEKNFYLMQLEENKEKDIQALRLRYNDETNEEILKNLDDAYKHDVRMFSDSEVAKLESDRDYLRDLIAQKKKAGLDTFEDEMNLAQVETSLRAAQLEKEFALNWNNAKEQFNAKKQYIEDELALEEISAERRAQLEQELAEITAEANMKKIDAAQNYANEAVSILSSVNDLTNNILAGQTAKYEEQQNAEKAALDRKLKSGLISQKQHDQRVAALDEQLEAKKAELDKKAAIRQKALSATQIIINTAAAIMRIWADVPKIDFGVSTGVLTGLATTTGALQLASVLAAPIPQARVGGKVQGATHEQGGVLVNTENDERIISSKPSRVFPELLNLISYIGKHADVPDTGYSARMIATESGAANSGADLEAVADRAAEKFAEKLKDLKIFLALSDLHDAERINTEIEESSKL